MLYIYTAAHWSQACPVPAYQSLMGLLRAKVRWNFHCHDVGMGVMSTTWHADESRWSHTRLPGYLRSMGPDSSDWGWAVRSRNFFWQRATRRLVVSSRRSFRPSNIEIHWWIQWWKNWLSIKNHDEYDWIHDTSLFSPSGNSSECAMEIIVFLSHWLRACRVPMYWSFLCQEPGCESWRGPRLEMASNWRKPWCLYQ